MTSCEHTPKHGRSALCPKCYKANWYATHRVEINAHRRQEYAVNSEVRNRALKQVAGWQKANPDKVAKRTERYVAKHGKGTLARSRRKYRNSETGRTTRKNWILKNIKRIRLQVRAAQHKRRARIAGNGGSWTVQEWLALKRGYGNRCVGCWKTEAELKALGRKLVPDHIVSVANGGLNHITNLQPLCQGKDGCNNKKGKRYIDFIIS